MGAIDSAGLSTLHDDPSSSHPPDYSLTVEIDRLGPYTITPENLTHLWVLCRQVYLIKTGTNLDIEDVDAAPWEIVSYDKAKRRLVVRTVA